MRDQIQGSSARLNMELYATARNSEDSPPEPWAVDEVDPTPEAGTHTAMSVSKGSLRRRVADCLS